MNVLDYVILVVSVIFVFVSGKKGFIKKGFGSLRLVASVVTTWTLTPKISPIVSEKLINNTVYNAVYDKLNEIYASLTDGFNAEEVLSRLPKYLVTDSIREALTNAEGEGVALVKSMAESISSPFSDLVATLLVGVVLFALTFFLYKCIVNYLEEFFQSITLLKVTNWVLGGVLGVAELLLVYIILFSFFDTVFYEYELVAGSWVIQKLSDTGLLSAVRSLYFKQIFADILTFNN